MRLPGLTLTGALLVTALVIRPGSQTPGLTRGEPVDISAGSGALFLVDVNRDRRLDLIASLRNERIGVWLGDGRGRFSFAQRGPTAVGEQPRALAVGDVNGDGAVDLAIALQDDASERVAIRLGDGTGRFLAHGRPLVLAMASKFYKPFLQLADLNGDKALDLLAGNERGAALQVLPGDGHGGFGAPLSVPRFPDYDHQASVLGDVDRDGHLDLLTSLKPGGSTQPSRLAVRYGDGRGHFTLRATPLTVAADHEVALVADLNGDAAPDLVLRHSEQVMLSVLLNNRRGQFTDAAGTPIALPLPAFAVVASDVNGDRIPDLVATTVDNQRAQGRSELAVLIGAGDGRFSRGADVVRTGPGGYQLASGDINGDRKPDFAVSSFPGPAITILLGQ